jgi:hypothetical protein
MPQTTPKPGRNFKLYVGAEGAALSAMTEYDSVVSVTPTRSKATSDHPTRANSGYNATFGNLKTVGYSIVMNYDTTTDSQFQTFVNAYHNDTLLELAELDGSKTTAGTKGCKGTFEITDIGEAHEVDGRVVATVTAVLRAWGSYVSI